MIETQCEDWEYIMDMSDQPAGIRRREGEFYLGRELWAGIGALRACWAPRIPGNIMPKSLPD